MKKSLSLLLILLFLWISLSAMALPAPVPDASAADIAENAFMREAILEAMAGIHAGHGGPFGCVIVKDGQIVGRGHNRVLIYNDPTAHGEITAIRDAGKNLGSHDLSGCMLYTTGEPCHMCLCAALWANIDLVYYGCTIEDNGLIGFRDDVFDRLFGGRDQLQDFLLPLDREACLKLFSEYNSMAPILY